ncbi:fumarylacetoacetate hydrolase family protein [Sphingobium phenoxybenzoativorans]|uniref:fumarylacetoacetate hydrolase family protein n=1 Tax=Sphingobium phenoxybenzoativorans TaxID=1592790 RepID=UPI000871BCD8|nr:fumarylacetoacetate hydrolase family protein [Sphingobium phenoxybenzoativorans]
MKLVTFSTSGEPMVGLSDGKGVAPLTGRLSEPVTDMISLMNAWDRVQPEIRAIGNFEIPLQDVTLHAPVTRPGKILAIGLNYADHAAEGGKAPPEYPMWFSKAATSVNGPYEPIDRPIVSEHLDYEAELVIVIGKRCRHVPKDRALDMIFGFCAGNDVSVRDWQLRTTQHFIGKSFDTHAPYGPWIVTPDEVSPANLAIRSYVNGELRQNSRTDQLIFDCAHQISYLSQVMTLEPGDILFTGTPSGVGAAKKPPLWLKAGDVVRVEIEGIGAIENRVVDEKAPLPA